ncbi:MAG: M23 family metallopeptidase [Gemmatimonadota bacterium]
MIGEKWQLRLQKYSGKEPHQTTLSGRAVAALATAGVVVCLLALVGLVSLVARGSEAVQTVQLERTNTILAEELADLKSRVGTLQEELLALEGKDSEIRILAGMDTIPADVRQVGVGGPGSVRPEDHRLHALDPKLGEEAFVAAYDLNAMERRARLLRESLEHAADSLRAHRSLLESTPSILPTRGRITSGFSSARAHPIHHRALPHEGIDISALRGTPILATANGRVTYAARRSGYGLVVEIDHGFGYSTIYAHADRILVQRGQTVERGEVIAQVGSTGMTTSPHLHYEVRVGGRPMNPTSYVITGVVP